MTHWATSSMLPTFALGNLILLPGPSPCCLCSLPDSSAGVPVCLSFLSALEGAAPSCPRAFTLAVSSPQSPLLLSWVNPDSDSRSHPSLPTPQTSSLSPWNTQEPNPGAMCSLPAPCQA